MEEEVLKKNWWGRNWAWFVPVGCLTGLLIFAGIIALLMSFVFGMMKSSPGYKEALTKARANALVIQNLGEPIVEGYFVSGNIKESGASGVAELAIPITGPKGNATVYVESKKSLGEWAILNLVVEINNSKQRINLMEVESK